MVTVDFIVVIVILVLFGLGSLWLLSRSSVLKTRTAWLISALLLALALGLRAAAFDYETLDYINFLSRWVEFFRQQGGFLALKYPVGNYNIPYLYFMALFSVLPMDDLYLIKLLSTASDLLLAWSVLLLCSRFTKSRPRLLASFFVTLFLPTVFLNSAVWGQCDSLYVAPVLLGFYCALSGHPRAAVILAAVSFGFKLQAVFLLPVYAVFLMTERISWKHLLFFPAAYLVLVLPAVCFGRPFWETISLYFSQTGSIGSGLNYNSPSVFAVFTDIRRPAVAATAGIVLAFLYMLNLLAVAWVYRRKLNEKAILAVSLLFAIGIPFLLPHMHERYFYGADILSLVLAFSFPSYSAAAVLVQFASLLGYHAYLKMRYLLLMNHGAAALIVAFAVALLCFLGALREGLPKAPRRQASSGKKPRSGGKRKTAK